MQQLRAEEKTFVIQAQNTEQPQNYLAKGIVENYSAHQVQSAPENASDFKVCLVMPYPHSLYQVINKL